MGEEGWGEPGRTTVRGEGDVGDVLLFSLSVRLRLCEGIGGLENAEGEADVCYGAEGEGGG